MILNIEVFIFAMERKSERGIYVMYVIAYQLVWGDGTRGTFILIIILILMTYLLSLPRIPYMIYATIIQLQNYTANIQ